MHPSHEANESIAAVPQANSAIYGTR